MVYLTKRVHFSASHRLHNPALSDEENRRMYGPCNNPRGHGHNYVLDVTVGGEPDPQTGMIVDLKEMSDIVHRQLVSQVDHTHLNHDVPWLQGLNPTVENLVRAFWKVLAGAIPRGSLCELRLYETDTSWASYRGTE